MPPFARNPPRLQPLCNPLPSTTSPARRVPPGKPSPRLRSGGATACSQAVKVANGDRNPWKPAPPTDLAPAGATETCDRPCAARTEAGASSASGEHIRPGPPPNPADARRPLRHGTIGREFACDGADRAGQWRSTGEREAGSATPERQPAPPQGEHQRFSGDPCSSFFSSDPDTSSGLTRCYGTSA